MKKFLVFLCFLFCHIIVSECSMKQLSKLYEWPLELMIECRDLTGVLNSELAEYFNSPPRALKSSSWETVAETVGCFMACIMQNLGWMTESTVELETLIQKMHSLDDSYSDETALIQKHMETCAEDVKVLNDPCKVALSFRECLSGLLKPRP